MTSVRTSCIQVTTVPLIGDKLDRQRRKCVAVSVVDPANSCTFKEVSIALRACMGYYAQECASPPHVASIWHEVLRNISSSRHFLDLSDAGFSHVLVTASEHRGRARKSLVSTVKPLKVACIARIATFVMPPTRQPCWLRPHISWRLRWSCR